jgi:hypothetical protein
MYMVSKSRTRVRAATEFVAAGAKGCRRVLLGIALAAGLGGCSSTLGDLPSQMGGLPAGTPERPATPAVYPAVHDMPPPRSDTVLSADEQKQAQSELATLRARQEKRAGDAAAKDNSDNK